MGGHVSYFTTHIRFRLELLKKLEIAQVIDENRHLYSNQSHFIRCAVKKLLDEHKSMSFKDLEAYQRDNEKLLAYGKKNTR